MPYTSNEIKIDQSFVNDYKFYDKKITKELGRIAPTIFERCALSTVYGAFFETLQSDCYLDVSDLTINNKLRVLDIGKSKYNLSQLYPHYITLSENPSTENICAYDVVFVNSFLSDTKKIRDVFNAIKNRCVYFLYTCKKENSYYACSIKGCAENKITY